MEILAKKLCFSMEKKVQRIGEFSVLERERGKSQHRATAVGEREREKRSGEKDEWACGSEMGFLLVETVGPTASPQAQPTFIQCPSAIIAQKREKEVNN